ncbi:hypothetical protein BUMB_02675 [Candidatus Paraburkholderia calva]|nr:hypothetical protein BUMB_02675 [Candidatus Paraburkholderia calva]
MKQHHIQSFLMVSAAFFAINAPTGGAHANQSPFEASPVRQVAQARVQSVRTTNEKRRDTERSDDDTVG